MKKALINEMLEAVKAVAGEEYQVSTEVIRKNNGVELQAVIIKTAEESITPTIYLDYYIDKIEKEELTVEAAAEEIFTFYKAHQYPEKQFDVNELTERKYVLDHVEYQLVNAERNADRLAGAPFRKLLDLAALYRVVVNASSVGSASFILTNEMMAVSGIDIEELDQAAIRNTQNKGFSVRTMQEVMSEMMAGMPKDMLEVTSSGPAMYVLTNHSGINGANILLFNEQLAEVAEKVKDDLFILPSSIHEVLAVPAGQMDTSNLKNMVQNVNETEVSPDEILGYEVYRYRRETNKLETV